MKLTDEVINDIRNNANIADVIGHYIPLVKKGKGYSAVCPFHDDHDPSLSISEDKQIYKCFVCGNGGNVFTFVQNFKKISFPESVVEVSKIIGKPIEIDMAPRKIDKNQKYYDLLSAFVSYGEYLLTGSKAGIEAKEYLTKRGLDNDVIEHFNIGLNPKKDEKTNKSPMYEYLHSKNYNDEDLIKTGICRMTNAGMLDVFFNRILFPIHNKDGNPIAFTARDYTNSSDSKYINSGETLTYVKGDNLYNYHRAIDASKKVQYVIVCEGVMDVIAYYRAGKENVVATLGTACTTRQIELLSNLSKHIVLSYDGDKAGQNADLKIGEMLLKAGLKVSVIDNKSDLDPDEIINKYDKNALRDLEGHKISYIDFAMNYYKSMLNLENYEDRKKMTLVMSKLIELLPDAYDRDNYYNSLYDLTKISKIESTNNNKKEYNKKDVVYNYSIDGLTKAEYTILVSIAMSKKALSIYQNDLGYLLDTNNQNLAMLIIDDYRNNDKCSLSRIFDTTNDQNIKNLISSLALVEGLPDNFDEIALKGSIEKVKREIKTRKLEFLKQKVNDNSIGDPQKANEYLSEYLKLVKELKQNG